MSVHVDTNSHGWLVFCDLCQVTIASRDPDQVRALVAVHELTPDLGWLDQAKEAPRS